MSASSLPAGDDTCGDDGTACDISGSLDDLGDKATERL